MQSTDKIADLITRIRNAINAGHNEVAMPSAKLTVAVANKLQAAGYIAEVKVEPAKPRDILHIVIAKNEPVISEITRVSKPGRRVYVGAEEMPRVKSGRGLAIVSTSRGIMTSFEAKKARVGGEVLLKVW
ncbi:MAG: 30S ribosomal protein S8 [Candidatus Nomurabacteria bacterium]|jgi:small subunit ribosomal protein S8|nr:30S ribosomal protein S8 [Candidatus Nomurabacteria bacterium]